MANPYKKTSQYKTIERFESRTRLYRMGAEILIRRMPSLEGLIYDAGCGTGNSTFVALKNSPQSADVVAIDNSKGMLDLAKAKFGFDMDLRQMVNDLFLQGETKLALHLLAFENEARPYKGRVDFVESDFLEFKGESANAIVGAQILHWLDKQALEQGMPPETVARKFAKLMKCGSHVALSSSMNFYRLTSHSADEFSYLRHPFVMKYLELLASKIEKESGRSAGSAKPQERKSPAETIALFESNGFEVEGYEEVPLPRLDPEVVIELNMPVVPEHLGMFNGCGLPEEEQKRLVSEAISETFSRHHRMLPADGIPSDVTPIFIFRKITLG